MPRSAWDVCNAWICLVILGYKTVLRPFHSISIVFHPTSWLVTLQWTTATPTSCNRGFIPRKCFRGVLPQLLPHHPTPMNNAVGSKPRMPPIPMPFGHSSADVGVGFAQGKWLQNDERHFFSSCFSETCAKTCHINSDLREVISAGHRPYKFNGWQLISGGRSCHGALMCLIYPYIVVNSCKLNKQPSIRDDWYTIHFWQNWRWLIILSQYCSSKYTSWLMINSGDIRGYQGISGDIRRIYICMIMYVYIIYIYIDSILISVTVI